MCRGFSTFHGLGHPSTGVWEHIPRGLGGLLKLDFKPRALNHKVVLSKTNGVGAKHT